MKVTPLFLLVNIRIPVFVGLGYVLLLMILSLIAKNYFFLCIIGLPR